MEPNEKRQERFVEPGTVFFGDEGAVCPGDGAAWVGEGTCHPGDGTVWPGENVVNPDAW